MTRGTPYPQGVFWEQVFLFELFTDRGRSQNIQCKGVTRKILVFNRMATGSRLGDADPLFRLPFGRPLFSIKGWA